MIRLAAVCVSLLSAGVPVLAQMPRDTPGPRAATAAIAGSVVSNDFDQRPVRHARVSCTASELSTGMTAVTDTNGGFRCDQLPAGRYSIVVSRDGWITT